MADSGAEVIRTAEGLVRGERSETLTIFKGLRYGEDTAATRFSPPVPVRPWEGIRDANTLGAPCIQRNIDPPVWLDPDEVGSEDCLFLNVWSPRGGEKLPVMVWIHGGAYVWGSGGAPMYDGTALAERGDVVVVTVNHRINIFGYLYLGGIAEQFHDSANLGQLDLIEALRWVQRNITAFGGDPTNVTLFGESGGSGKISSLLAMPAAQGLFAKAILQSGAPLKVQHPDRHTNLARALMSELGITDDGIDSLRSLDARQLFAAFEAVEGPLGCEADFQVGVAPIQHAATIPYQLDSLEAHQLWSEIPVMLGITEEETVFFFVLSNEGGVVPNPGDDAALAAEIQGLCTDMSAADAQSLIRAYRDAMPDADRAHLLVAVTTGYWIWHAAERQAELKASQNAAPVYVYIFGWKDPIAGGSWAVHGEDVGFVFDMFEVPEYLEFGVDTASIRAAADPDGHRYSLRNATMDSWIAFAQNATPSSAHLPPWPPYTLEKRSVMRLDAHSRLWDDPWGPAVRKQLRAVNSTE